MIKLTPFRSQSLCSILSSISMASRVPLVPKLIASSRRFSCSPSCCYRSKAQHAMVTLVDKENHSGLEAPLIGVDRELNLKPQESEVQKSELRNIFKPFISSNNQLETMCFKYPEIMIDLKYVKHSLEILQEDFDVDLRCGIISNHPWILILNHDHLRSRIKLLLKAFQEHGVQPEALPFDSFGPLFILKSTRPNQSFRMFSMSKLIELYELEGNENRFNERLDYFSSHFSISHLRSVEYFQIHPHLFTLEFNRIRDITKTLTQSAEINPEDILKDLRIYKMKPEFVHSRLGVLKEIEMNPIKVWMLRCQEHIIDSTIRLWKQRVQVFGSSRSNAIDYLSRTLKIPGEEVTRMNQSCPQLLTTRPAKLKKMTEYLFSIGATTQDIVECPRIYQKSVQTVKARVEILRRRRLSKLERKLHILKSTEKRFQEICTKKRRKIRRKRGTKDEPAPPSGDE